MLEVVDKISYKSTPVNLHIPISASSELACVARLSLVAKNAAGSVPQGKRLGCDEGRGGQWRIERLSAAY